MKLYFENDNLNSVSIKETLNESGEKEKHYVLKGIFSSPGVKNKNGRIYPLNLWEREVAKYQEVIKSGTSNSLMELNHPPRTQVDMMEAVGKMKRLWIENGYVMGEAVLLDNPKANQLKTLIDNGIKMSVSSRSVGNCVNGEVKDFHLITFDIIPNQEQSDINASMMGIVEGCLENKDFMMVGEAVVEVKDAEKFKEELKKEIKDEISGKNTKEAKVNKSENTDTLKDAENAETDDDIIQDIKVDDDEIKLEIKKLSDTDLKAIQDKIKNSFNDILSKLVLKD